MRVSFRCGREHVSVDVPDNAIIYQSRFPAPAPAAQLVENALDRPVDSLPLKEALGARSGGDVVIVVSDVTRPIPYAEFLPLMMATVESAGVPHEEIFILIATGMHRPSTAEERIEMFGPDIVQRYRIVDHAADDPGALVTLTGKSWSGSAVRLNRRYVQAGFRIITGLVEPHFMAGFSGGRKAVFPGLTALDSVCKFHSYEFLADSRARNGILDGNPCHLESLSAARLAGVDFSLNIVLNKDRETVAAFAGELEGAHREACAFVRDCAIRLVERSADIVLTSCGGYPLDATFYQCVKGMVSCLPALRDGGTIVAFGGCSEGIGSPEYIATMKKYAGRWPDFLTDIQRPGPFIKDQWQFQMHCLALDKIGQGNLIFITGGLDQNQLDKLSVNGQTAGQGEVGQMLNEILHRQSYHGKQVAVFPEGPYCAPVSR